MSLHSTDSKCQSSSQNGTVWTSDVALYLCALLRVSRETTM